ncbi:hypothetical protein EG328_009962 [Venturia inaequalis]|uniref:Uncharacterized protein n=1 Tax=Venturia inaequalis TaxID=5025 RepID=A0A8H3U8Q7_VENIN|nr:hypothetical protein EG328_009962 [Venturia inaequalis]
MASLTNENPKTPRAKRSRELDSMPSTPTAQRLKPNDAEPPSSAHSANSVTSDGLFPFHRHCMCIEYIQEDRKDIIQDMDQIEAELNDTKEELEIAQDRVAYLEGKLEGVIATKRNLARTMSDNRKLYKTHVSRLARTLVQQNPGFEAMDEAQRMILWQDIVRIHGVTYQLPEPEDFEVVESWMK